MNVVGMNNDFIVRALGALKSMLYTQAIIIVRIKEWNVLDNKLAGECSFFSDSHAELWLLCDYMISCSILYLVTNDSTNFRTLVTEVVYARIYGFVR